MPKYQSTGENWVLRLADQARIPFHDENPDYIQYLSWVAAGGVPDPCPNLPVPQSLTRAQARAALIVSGLIDQVQPAIDAIQDPVQRALVQNDWDNRLTFERNNTTLLALSGLLGLADGAIDDLFRLGVTL